jgi:hypothetical protein
LVCLVAQHSKVARVPPPPPTHTYAQFTQKKADGQVRWSVLNVAALLRRHAGGWLGLSKLAQALCEPGRSPLLSRAVSAGEGLHE